MSLLDRHAPPLARPEAPTAEGPRRSGPITAVAFVTAAALLLLSCGSDPDVQATVVDEQVDVGTEDPPLVEGAPDDEQDGDVADGQVAQGGLEGEVEAEDQGGAVIAEGGDGAQPETPPGRDDAEGQTAGAAPSADGTGTPAAGAPGTPNSAGTDPDGGDNPGDNGDDGLDPENDPAAVDRVGQGFPASAVTDLQSGNDVDLAEELRSSDQRVLLWFWAPGSGASEAEADVVQRLADETGDGLAVVAIGVGGDAETAARFPADSGLNDVTIVWDGTTQNAEQYQVTTLPSAILLDTNGDIIGRWTTISPEVFELVSLLAG